MKDSDKDRFRNSMAGLSEVFGGILSNERLSLYWLLLEQYDIEQIEKAIIGILREKTTAAFPKPAEIIHAIEGTPTDNSVRALAEVEKAMKVIGGYRSVTFNDLLIHKVIERMGGWWRICQEVDWKFERNNFLKLYEATRKEQITKSPEFLIGKCDAINALEGHKDFVREPMVVSEKTEGVKQLR